MVSQKTHDTPAPVAAPAPAGPGGTLTEGQKQVKRIVAFIRNRRKLDTSFLKLTQYKQRGADKPTAGYGWGGGSGAGTTPSDLKQAAPEGGALAAKRKQAQGWTPAGSPSPTTT